MAYFEVFSVFFCFFSVFFLLFVLEQRRMQPGPRTGSNGATTHRSHGGATTGSNSRERRSTHRSNGTTGSNAREQQENREPQPEATGKPEEQRSKGTTRSNNRKQRSTHRITGKHGSSSPKTHRPPMHGAAEQPGATDWQQPEATGKSQERRSNGTAGSNNG